MSNVRRLASRKATGSDLDWGDSFGGSTVRSSRDLGVGVWVDEEGGIPGGRQVATSRARSPPICLQALPRDCSAQLFLYWTPTPRSTHSLYSRPTLAIPLISPESSNPR